MSTVARMRAAIGAVLVAALLSGCARSAAGGAATGPTGGYGVGPVEGKTLPAMLDRCAATGSASPECAQLQRTRHTQPGNGAP